MYSTNPQFYTGLNWSKSENNITIDDIIGALQSAKDSAKMAQEKLAAVNKAHQPCRPVDFNKGPVSYMVAECLFASGKVWQPLGQLHPNLKEAQEYADSLRSQDPSRQIEVFPLTWGKAVGSEEEYVDAEEENNPDAPEAKFFKRWMEKTFKDGVPNDSPDSDEENGGRNW